MSGKERITVRFTVNAQDVDAEVPPDMNLMRFLREEMGLTGTKNGCENGHCGSCTVVIDGAARRACLVKMKNIEGAQVETIEGLSQDGALHPLQQAFLETGAVQCGFCTPGMIMTAKALLDSNPNPTHEEIKSALTTNRNLCRCTGYVSILEAIQLATVRMAKLGDSHMLPIAKQLMSNPQLKAEAIKKVTGTCLYADDLSKERMLYGKILWAAHPHAKILGIDTSEAEEVEGVALVLTAKDIPGKNQAGILVRDQPAIAADKVRYIGDSVASVFAETEQIAERAREKIRVEYEVLEGVFTPQEAAKPDAPRVHSQGNLVKHAAIVRGDVDKAFSECAVVVEETYATPFIEHAFLEPESALAYPDGEGGVVLEMGSQALFDDRTQLSEILDLPEEKIRVIQAPQGGSFGGKEDMILQQHLALAALRTGRPAKITLTREESLRVHVKRHPAWIGYKTGADKNGRILALEADITLDAGAYMSLSGDVLENTVVFAAGPYYVPNLRIDGKVWYTNNVLTGAMRGFGVNQMAIGLEQQIDAMARALDIDPFAFRMINALETGLPTAADHVLEEGVAGIKETIQGAQEAFEQLELPTAAKGKKIGVGVASAVKNVGFGHGFEETAGAIVRLNAKGQVQLGVSHYEYGQGAWAGQIKIASHELGIPVDQIEVVRPDTAVTPPTGPTTASRQTFLTGSAVVLACRALKEQVFGHAAEALDAEPRNLALHGSTVVDQASGASIQLAELGEEFVVEKQYASPPTDQLLEGEASHYGEADFKSRVTHVMYSYTTQIAVVEVDPETGEASVLKIISACDVGKALNPQIVKGQIQGGAMMGLGYALSESYVVERGINLTDTLHKARIPAADQTPEIIPVIVEVPHPFSPLGMKGFAEAPSLATAPAILNAIHDAVGIRIRHIPADKKKVLAALEKR
ncbi:MAG: molybdopterin-dependent oxidoreductase [Anaerolineales bacterium]|jgi:CO/xanthine dehydrogenase Mo-binding subunit/aerobic-type carbon monoxide dehydrogenase small subunit (CoxS/CutS family)